MRAKSLVSWIPDPVKDLLPGRLRKVARAELHKLDIDIERPLIIAVMDSCRYDVFSRIEDDWVEERTLIKGYTDANWTIPSHEAILRGSIPNNPEILSRDILANDYYKSAAPLSIQHDFSFGFTAVPFLSRSEYIANPFHQYFDEYECFSDHQSADEVTERAIDAMEGRDDFFGLLNFGETHHPWTLPPDEAQELGERAKEDEEARERAKELMREGAETIISRVREIEEAAPDGTQIILTSDHGEILGENDEFGHSNPNTSVTFHKKLFEVPTLYWNVGEV